MTSLRVIDMMIPDTHLDTQFTHQETIDCNCLCCVKSRTRARYSNVQAVSAHENNDGIGDEASSDSAVSFPEDNVVNNYADSQKLINQCNKKQFTNYEDNQQISHGCMNYIQVINDDCTHLEPISGFCAYQHLLQDNTYSRDYSTLQVNDQVL